MPVRGPTVTTCVVSFCKEIHQIFVRYWLILREVEVKTLIRNCTVYRKVVPWLRWLVARHFTEETRVRSQVRSCEVCCRQSGTGAGFSSGFSVSLSIFFHRGFPYSYIIFEVNNWYVGGRNSET